LKNYDCGAMIEHLIFWHEGMWECQTPPV
jgi:hypothetical protein